MSDGLEQLRRELSELDDLAVGQRVARFERVNEALAQQLAELDELTAG